SSTERAAVIHSPPRAGRAERYRFRVTVAPDRRPLSGTAAVVFAAFAALGPLLMVAVFAILWLMPSGDEIGPGLLTIVIAFIIELVLSPASAVVAIILGLVAWRAGVRRQVAVAAILLGVAVALLIIQVYLYGGGWI